MSKQSFQFHFHRTNYIHAKRARTLLYQIEPIYRLSKLYQEEKANNLEPLFDEILKNKLSDWRETTISNDGIQLGISPYTKPENNFSYDEIRDSMKGLIFAVSLNI
jgi:hypothetical protein